MAAEGHYWTVFLAEATALLASSTDCEATLRAVARMAVPCLGDICAVHLVGPDGSVRLAALEGAPIAPPEVIRGVKRALLTGRPELVSGSSVHIPLAARGRVLGSISLMFDESGRRYDAAAIARAESLGRHAALALDSARLHLEVERERASAGEAREILRENERWLRMALDAGRMAIWDWNMRTGRIDWKGDLGKDFAFGGFDTLVSLVHQEDRPAFLAAMHRARHERAYFDVEFRLLSSDVSSRWLAAKGNAFCDEDGVPERMIGVVTDISERRQLEQKLRRAQTLETTGLLAGGIAHDFNNLLTSVLGNASLIATMVPPESDTAGLLKDLMASAERAAELTSQLLAYAGKAHIVFRRADLSAVLRECGGPIARVMPQDVEFQLDLGHDLPVIEADAAQLQQVAMSLVLNAAEAIPDGRQGWIRMRTCHFTVPPPGSPGDDLAPGDYACLEVSDNGCGMSAETQNKIFEPFFTTKFLGRGLGLAAVAGIVASHRGAIRVESAVGRGSTFRILFPSSALALAQRPE